MRDDGQFWQPFDLDAPMQREGVRLTRVHHRQQMVSGEWRQLFPGRAALGWAERATGQGDLLALRRDRVFLVGGAALPEGWHETGCLISDVTDGRVIYDLAGPAAFALLQMGAEIALNQPSASVARRLFEFTVLVYRLPPEDAFRLHVGRADGPAFRLWADRCAGLLLGA